MKFGPVGERALAKPVEHEEMTASGTVLPPTTGEKPRTAKVMAVGRFENGVRVDEGDVVGFARRSIEAGVNKPANAVGAISRPRSQYVDEHGYSVGR